MHGDLRDYSSNEWIPCTRVGAMEEGADGAKNRTFVSDVTCHRIRGPRTWGMDARPSAAGDPRREITELLGELNEGRPEAMDRLIPLVYDELKRIARAQHARERAAHTLDTTAIVHEAYIRLVGLDGIDWRDRSHFFAAAAGAMRRILVDYARRYRASKRGGGLGPLTLDPHVVGVEERADTLVALDEALARLAEIDARRARVVEYRFFLGLTETETAKALGVTERTVRREWVKAKAWLSYAMRG
jgi:RNA polymerase sigma factor (TIGR02999 family)